MSDSDFLFSMPSFLTGVGRNVDLFGNMTEYNISETPEEADTRALMKDGFAVRKDLSAAFEAIREEID
jgi:hypothetical protein